MSEEIIVNVTPMETRVALVDSGLLQEIFIERTNGRGHVGDIFVGKVLRVLPGMGAAFVDIGLERSAFIHCADVSAISPEGFEIEKDASATISSLLREGQILVVQVQKDPIGGKGARLTTQLSLPSRNLVYLPRNKYIGISQRLEDAAERERLLALLDSCVQKVQLTDMGGFIIRTAAEGISENELIEDMRFLKKLWQTVQQQFGNEQQIKIVYQELPLYLRAMRDLVTPAVEKIRVDTAEAHAQITRFLHEFIPEYDNSVEHYSGERSVFDLYGIEDEINKALARQVKLKSGGDLIIDQTEAMTTIDVNTGAFIGSSNHADTVLKTNLEAAAAIARQVRLRNIGGIIMLDFIDMLDPEHQRQVLRALTRALENDRARTHISGISELGLVEMTRKRTRESLTQILCDQCPVCQGRARLKTPETVCYEIFRELMRVARTSQSAPLLVIAAQSVVDRLLDEDSDALANLEQLLGRTVKFEVEPMYTPEQYDVILTQHAAVSV